MSSDPYQIRVAHRDELDTMLQWAAEEGWNPGLYDAAAFFAADPGGFLIGLLEGEPIASISVVRYSDDYGFLGLYLVRPRYRGRGYGLRLWNAGLSHLGSRAVGLDGALAHNLEMAPMFETARMYKGAPAMPAMDRCYGITTYELG